MIIMKMIQIQMDRLYDSYEDEYKSSYDSYEEYKSIDATYGKYDSYGDKDKKEFTLYKEESPRTGVLASAPSATPVQAKCDAGDKYISGGFSVDPSSPNSSLPPINQLTSNANLGDTMNSMNSMNSMNPMNPMNPHQQDVQSHDVTLDSGGSPVVDLSQHL